jgi:hypothetical protein
MKLLERYNEVCFDFVEKRHELLSIEEEQKNREV